MLGNPHLLGTFLTRASNVNEFLCSQFWFGWTSTASIHWIVPIIGSSFFSVGTFCLFQSVVNYLASFAPSSSVGHTHPVPQPDSYPGYAASILAGNNFFRAIVGGAFPLFARAMFENLQKKNGPAAFPVSWGCTLCEYSSCFKAKRALTENQWDAYH